MSVHRTATRSWRFPVAPGLPFVIICLLAAVVGCAGGAPSRETGPAPAVAPEVRKTVTLGQTNAAKGYAPWDFSDTSGGGGMLIEIHSVGLDSLDSQGNRVRRLASRIPSLEDGSVVVRSDGRMQVTWTLRQGVTWHDGAPFTAEDLAFSWEVIRDPDISTSSVGMLVNVVRNIESVQAVDPHTVVVAWKAPNYKALDMGIRNFWIFPRHLLADAYQEGREAFIVQQYFTSEYIHLGPFRLADFQAGEQQVFRRVDNYFLGRPKLDTIVIKTVRDPNTLFANLRAGAIDAVGERTLSGGLFLQLREEWGQTGEGRVLDRQYNWRYLQVQFGLPWARPIELAQDVRVRSGLLRAIDREALREFLYPGFADTSADSFMLSADPRAAGVGKPFAAYGYDVNRAMAELADAGWQRAPDARLVGRDGQQVQIEIRGSSTDAQGVAPVADFWRRIGIDASELILSGQTSDSPEFRATFPGAESTSRQSGEDIFPGFDGRLQSLAENRWTGANRMHYGNPALDRLIDRAYATVDQRESTQILKEVGELFAADVSVLPLHFVMEFAAARRGVRGPLEDFPTSGPTTAPGQIARSAHLWDHE